MDRNTTNLARGQIGFIDFVIKPCWVPLIKVFPRLSHIVDALEVNKLNWTSLFDEYEE